MKDYQLLKFDWTTPLGILLTAVVMADFISAFRTIGEISKGM